MVEKHKVSSDHDSRYYTQDQTDNKLEAAIAGKKAKRIARCYSNASSQPTYFKLAQVRIPVYNNLQGTFNLFCMSGALTMAAKVHWAMRNNGNNGLDINSFKIISSTSSLFFTDNKDTFFLTYSFEGNVLIVNFWGYVKTSYTGIVFEPDTSFFDLPTNEQSITVFEHPDISTGQTEEPEGTPVYLKYAETFSKYPNGLYVTDTSWTPNNSGLNIGNSVLVTLSGAFMSNLLNLNQIHTGILTRIDSTTYYIAAYSNPVNHNIALLRYISSSNIWEITDSYKLPKYPNGLYVNNTSWKPTDTTLVTGESCSIIIATGVMEAITGTNRFAFGTLSCIATNIYTLSLRNANLDKTTKTWLLRYSENTWTSMKESDLPKYPNGLYISSGSWNPTQTTLSNGETVPFQCTAAATSAITNGAYSLTLSGTFARKSDGVYDFLGQLGNGDSGLIAGRYYNNAWTYMLYSPG